MTCFLLFLIHLRLCDLFIHCLNSAKKFLKFDKLTKMPFCNLAKTVHNKWLQAFSNKGADFYVDVVNDYIQAFLQVVAYYQFLKDGATGVDSSKDKLKLEFALY